MVRTEIGQQALQEIADVLIAHQFQIVEKQGNRRVRQ
jgi:hypothetical protein